MDNATCAVDGCARTTKKRSKLCSAHSHRLYRYGDPLGRPERKSRPVRRCEMDGCESVHYGKGLCVLHYGRLARHGDALWEPVKMPDACSISGCDLPTRARGWCNNHYALWRRNGDPTSFAPPRREDVTGRKFGRLTVVSYDTSKYEWSCMCECGATTLASIDRLKNGKAVSCGRGGPCAWRVESPGYRAMHARVQRLRGKASSHPCIDCGEIAAQWSYDHADPDEVVEAIGAATVAYSTRVAHYSPRCVSCHTAFDRYEKPWA